MRKFYFFLFLLTTNVHWGQLFINEASNSNGIVFVLPNGTSPDWIEIYNAENFAVSLQGYALSDNPNQLQKWFFPPTQIGAQQYLTVIAAGNSSQALVNHYETAVDTSYLWHYTLPISNIPNWREESFVPNGWQIDKMGIGYGDGDDTTDIVGPYNTLYARTNFNLTNFNDITKAILDIDYDDGFVAYINGTEVARSGIVGNPPAYDDVATDHEALLYQGQPITGFNLNMGILNNVLHNGTNTLAIEVHNTNPFDDDLTCRPFLSFGFATVNQQFNGNTHPYFNNNYGGEIETNFGIATAGETIYLSNPFGQLIDSMYVPDLEPNMSIGKITDGFGPHVVFPNPTPNVSNNAAQGYVGYETIPLIQTHGGIFQNSIQVNVTNQSTQNGIVRYTLNGQDPDTNSTVFVGPLTIGSNAVLKVRCFANGTNLLPSPVEAETFLFSETSTIPIVSLTINNEDLYGGNGIFDNWWTDWKKGCIIEYFDENGIKQFESKASVKPDGGAGGSRSNPQHSVTVEPANNTFGTGNPVHYPIIPEKPHVKDYYALFIRNGSNFWNQYPQRDATFMRIMRKSLTNSQAYRPANVYINGSYFGVYELREKANEGYFTENYGNNPDSIDLLSVSYWYGSYLRTVKGSDTSFHTMVDFIKNFDKLDSNYLKYCDLKLDTKNFADYMIGENWYANTDWIWNNMKIARPRTFDNRWKFFLQDLEWGLGGWTDYNANMFNHIAYGNLPNYYNDIYMNLLQDSIYKKYFINRFADLMNTTFHPNHYLPIINQMYNELLPEMPRHFQLWTGDVAGGLANYFNQKESIVYQFANRSPVVRQQIVSTFGLVKPVDVTLYAAPPQAGYIKISTIVPDSLPWTGVYFDGNPVEITAVANPGYTFKYWDNNSNIPDSLKETASLDLNIATSSFFIAVFEGVKADTTLTLSEINYNPDDTHNGGNWIEIHNYGDHEINLTSWTLKSNDFYDLFEFPDHTKIPAKGHLVIAQNLSQFMGVYPNVTNVIGSTRFGWTNSEDSIYLFAPNQDTVIAMKFHGNWSSMRCADGFGRTMENGVLNKTDFNENVWFCGCIAGSPGEAYSPCSEDLVVSEFNLGKDQIPYNAEDWIELQNTGSAAISLNGYIFKDEKDDHIFPLDGMTLEPGEFMVIAKDSGLFHYRHPDFTGKILYGMPFGISKKDAMRIYNSNGTLIQSINYDSVPTWPSVPFATDFTFEYSVGGENQTLGEFWFAGCEGGSPGRMFSPCPIYYGDELAIIFPNPTSDILNLSINNMGSDKGTTEITIYNLEGQLLKTSSLPSSIEKVIGTTLDVSTLSHGLYYIRIQKSKAVISLPFIKI